MYVFVLLLPKRFSCSNGPISFEYIFIHRPTIQHCAVKTGRKNRQNKEAFPNGSFFMLLQKPREKNAQETNISRLLLIRELTMLRVLNIQRKYLSSSLKTDGVII